MYLQGQPVYIDDQFKGYYVENLTDDIEGEDQKFYQRLKKHGPMGKHIWDDSSLILPTPYYSRRMVYNERFGTVNQILIVAVNDEMAWINI